jgi:hypothetical protein
MTQKPSRYCYFVLFINSFAKNKKEREREREREEKKDNINKINNR